MKNYLYILMIPAALGLLVSCGNAETDPAGDGDKDSLLTVAVTYDEIQKASWMLGTWENNADGATVSEIWTKLDDSTFTGKGLFMAGTDTLESEDLQLEERMGQLYYIPTVQNQNDGQPVRFTMTSATESELVFENPEHNFPQKITYTLINQDSIVAVISGIYESQESSQPFPFSRVK